MRISDWSSDVCSSDLHGPAVRAKRRSGVADRTRCFRKAGRYARKTQVPLIGIPLFPEAGRLQMRVMQQIRGACDQRGRNLGLSHQFKRSEEHTSELQSLMRISYAVFGLKKKNTNTK